MLRRIAGFKLAALCCCFLALAACSKKNSPDLEATSGLTAVPGSEDQFKTEVGDTVLFVVDQSTLTSEGQDTLRKQAAWLKQYPNVSIQVSGHADERGTREYNISLSAKRASASRAFLIAQGIEESRVASIAYGKERPVALCDAEQCWTKNRRSVTVITSGAATS